MLRKYLPLPSLHRDDWNMAVFGVGFGRHGHFTILHYPARHEDWGPCVYVDVTCLASTGKGGVWGRPSGDARRTSRSERRSQTKVSKGVGDGGEVSSAARASASRCARGMRRGSRVASGRGRTPCQSVGRSAARPDCSGDPDPSYLPAVALGIGR